MLNTNVETKDANMATQIHDAKSLPAEDYNCIRCGFTYKSIITIPSTQNSIVIQIMECSRCGYLWKEIWEQPMWRHPVLI